MGMVVALGSLLVACIGVWYARRQVYLNHKYVAWSSIRFGLAKTPFWTYTYLTHSRTSS
ncbi:hypothetical protein EV650_7689 [Kribbella kalugense]|uniref:Uncharacterized protein n=1 Tax=Kribbella kalugense TaxID=2512221 RepID=A0A4R7ZBC4_9ACTN|nr:hypothetical protein EV650_7689 [Kribbella kalugense]